MLISHKSGFRPTGVIFCALFTIAAIGFAGTYSGGSGTAEDPYKISTVADWQELIGTSVDWDKQFILLNDIDFGGINLTPVAPDTDLKFLNEFQGTPFTGIFDGNNHFLRNGAMNLATSDYVGLFGCLGSDGQIKSLSLENVSIIGRSFVGGVCGSNGDRMENGGIIQNCATTGTVIGTHTIGGICGGNYAGTLCDCRSNGDIGKPDSDVAGGLCGDNGGTIIRCTAAGSVTGRNYVGGLCGGSVCYPVQEVPVTGIIRDCRATGSITGSGQYIGGLCGLNVGNIITNSLATGMVAGGNDIGGLCGRNQNAMIYGNSLTATISGCHASGEVKGLYSGSSSLGGLCGINDGGIIDESYALGSVSNGINSYNTGGLCGTNRRGTIDSCRAEGNVTCGDDSLSIGGLVGSNGALNSDYGGTIIDCHASGSVTGGSRTRYLGGLCGFNGDSGRLDEHSHLIKCTIADSSASGAVSGGENSQCGGGLCGFNFLTGVILRCYASSSVSGVVKSGGLCGYNFELGEIRLCYSTGTIFGGTFSASAGGLCGHNNGTIDSCYSSGLVNGSQAGGGLVGSSGTPFGGGGFVSSSFWDMEFTGNTYSAGGEGKTTVQMKAKATFTDAGWDFVGEGANGAEDVWRMCGDGVAYPRLSWEFSQGGDMDCPDGVALEDLLYLAGRWMARTPETVGAADGNGDGKVDLGDFEVLASNWVRE